MSDGMIVFLIASLFLSNIVFLLLGAFIGSRSQRDRIVKEIVSVVKRDEVGAVQALSAEELEAKNSKKYEASKDYKNFWEKLIRS